MVSNSEKQRRMEIRRKLGNRRFGTSFAQPPVGPEYLVAYVCLPCRRSFKRRHEPESWYRKCSRCGGWALDVGRDFKPPKASDDSQWAKIEFLVKHGFVFQRIRKGLAGEQVPYPRTLREARTFVKDFIDQAIDVPPPPREEPKD